jgi:hypothetical protein
MNGDYDDLTWQHDNAVLHFEPDLQNTQSSYSTTFVPEAPAMEPKPRSKLSETSKILLQPTTKVKKVASRKGKQKASKKKLETLSDTDLNSVEGDLSEEMESRILQTIRDDKQLHLRILRYEVRLAFHALLLCLRSNRCVQPIPFDDFMQLVTRLGVPARGLKPRLCQFLDKQVRTLALKLVY